MRERVLGEENQIYFNGAGALLGPYTHTSTNAGRVHVAQRAHSDGAERTCVIRRTAAPIGQGRFG
eukprot:13739324-Alexandrium_andersonii.AAC.1